MKRAWLLGLSLHVGTMLLFAAAGTLVLMAQ